MLQQLESFGTTRGHIQPSLPLGDEQERRSRGGSATTRTVFGAAETTRLSGYGRCWLSTAIPCPDRRKPLASVTWAWAARVVHCATQYGWHGAQLGADCAEGGAESGFRTATPTRFRCR